jgi:hypothetical protein
MDGQVKIYRKVENRVDIRKIAKRADVQKISILRRKKRKITDE